MLLSGFILNQLKLGVQNLNLFKHFSGASHVHIWLTNIGTESINDTNVQPVLRTSNSVNKHTSKQKTQKIIVPHSFVK